MDSGAFYGLLGLGIGAVFVASWIHDKTKGFTLTEDLRKEPVDETDVPDNFWFHEDLVEDDFLDPGYYQAWLEARKTKDNEAYEEYLASRGTPAMREVPVFDTEQYPTLTPDNLAAKFGKAYDPTIKAEPVPPAPAETSVAYMSRALAAYATREHVVETALDELEQEWLSSWSNVSPITLDHAVTQFLDKVRPLKQHTQAEIAALIASTPFNEFSDIPA